MNSPRAPLTIPAHNIFTFDDIIFSSNFDNGNLGKVERVPNKPYDFRIWTAPDNMGTEYQSKHCAWFHFVVSGLPLGCVLRIQIVNASNHSGLYKFDMRPVYRCNSTGQRWSRIKSSVRFNKETEGSAQLFFEHGVDSNDDKIYFSFTYPYSYTTMQNELSAITHENDLTKPDSLFYQRELLTLSRDGRRVELLTISSVEGHSITEKEPLLSGLFPDSPSASDNKRPPVFPNKEIMFISARVHPGEVPAQHTFKGILNLLLDPDDLTARELRARYVFKLIPMLNPDGVYRGHFRMDDIGQNLNRYYCNPDPTLQPSIFAAKSLMDHYASINKLSVYMDFHAHASKRGCFIYGNVLDSVEDQIQNQLYCKLISMNSAHFDYEGCLFSREHMFRTDPGDQAKGLTAEGSGRVWTYLAHGLIHSYTIECNYNTSRVGNEIAAPETDPGGSSVTQPANFTTNPEKYTPSTYAGVGRACVVAILDLKAHNPCSRITRSKLKTLERVRNFVMMEVRNKREFLGKPMTRDRRRVERKSGGDKAAPGPDEVMWRRVVEAEGSAAPSSAGTSTSVLTSSSSKVSSAATSSVIYIPSKERRRRRSMASNPLTSSAVDQDNQPMIQSPLVPTPPPPHRVVSNDELASSGNNSGGVGSDSLSGGKMAGFFGGARKAAYTSSSQLSSGIASVRLDDDSHRDNSNSSPLNNKEFRAIGERNHPEAEDLHPSGSLSARDRRAADSPTVLQSIIGSAKQVTSGMPPPRRTSASPRVGHKDNRKILGKALNPAGVALLMAGMSGSSSATPPPIHSHSPRVGPEGQSSNSNGPPHSTPHSVNSLPEMLIINSATSSRKELLAAPASSSATREQHASLPDIVARKNASTDDLPHLSTVPIDSSATLNRLVAATLIKGGSSDGMDDFIVGGAPRKGSYSIKAALQLSAFPPPGTDGKSNKDVFR